MLSIVIEGTEYNLATTLRVAFNVQGQHNHKPYTEVFKDIGNMNVQDQIGIVYAAFTCANPGVVNFKTGKSEPTISRKSFEDYFLDNYNLKDLMDKLQEIIQGIMGTEVDENAPATQEPSEESEAEGN